jgi:hypothetical protein
VYLGWDSEPPPPIQPRQPAPPRNGRPPEQHAAAALRLADPTLAVEPGGSVEVTATVYNGGSQVEEFAITIAGPTFRWATVEPEALTVYPGERAECVVRFALPRSPEVLGGRAPFTVRAASTVHPGLVAAGDGTLEIGAFRAVTAVLVPEQTSGWGPTVHRLEVTNAGNVVEPVQVQVQAKDQDRQVSFDVPRGEVSAAPGRSVVNIGVRPKFRLAGAPRWHPFEVVVIPRPPVSPMRIEGRMQGRALVPHWVVVIVVVLVFVLCVELLQRLP